MARQPKPRSYSAKGLATFCRARTARIRSELTLIAGAYGDVDQYVVNCADDLMVEIDKLDEAFDEAVTSGRDAL